MGVVYKKTCSDSGLIYYGKFEGTWEHRCSAGWSDCSCEYFVNPTHEFIEIDIPNDKLVEREQFYINNNECVNIMGKYSHLTKAEYDKQYNINNKESITKRNKQYRIDNPEYFKQYQIDNKETIAKQKKQYRIDNQEYFKQYGKQYKIDNRDIIAKQSKQYWIDNKERMNQKIKCNNCGSTIVKRNLKIHQTSKKCMNFTV